MKKNMDTHKIPYIEVCGDLFKQHEKRFDGINFILKMYSLNNLVDIGPFHTNSEIKSCSKLYLSISSYREREIYSHIMSCVWCFICTKISV